MALPINVNDLMSKNKVEGNRIEFKKGWNLQRFIIRFVPLPMILIIWEVLYSCSVDEENGMQNVQ